MTAADIILIVECAQHDTSTEDAFQRSTAAALEAAGVEFSREFRLTSRDRLDFLIDRVAVELKISGLPNEVIRQLQRYAQHKDIDEIILLTSKTSLCRMPKQLSGKPIHIALVQRGLR